MLHVALLFIVPLLAWGQTRPTADDLEQAIFHAYRSGQSRFVIPPGTYRLSPTPEGPHLWFQGLTNFEIVADDVHLILTDRLRSGIEFHECRNVRFRGATIAYETPPFTQGIIQRIAPDGRFYDIRIENGYPADFDDPRYFPPAPIGYLFDPKTRSLRRGADDLYGNRIERLGPRVFRVHWIRPFSKDVEPVAAGDLIAFRGSGPHNISVIESAAISLSGVTIYNSPDFAVLESGGEGGNHYSVDVRRGPPPRGARTPPLFSSTADAFHSVNVRKGPELENCHFEYMGDDGIAIHGTYSHVMQAAGGRLVISNNTFRPGDPIRLFDTHDGPAGEGVVEAVKPVPEFRFQKKSDRETLGDNTTGPYFEVTFYPALAAGFDYLAENPAAVGSGYVLRGNVIREHRGRGLLLKANEGVIENNTIDGSSMGGIVLTPEFWWNEAGFSRHVTVRGNTIRSVAYAPKQLGGVVLAAIDGTPVAGCGHEDVRFENNRFENIDGVNLLITSACGVLVRGNRFVNAQHSATDAAGSPSGDDPRTLIFVTQAHDVTLTENSVVNLGRFNKMFVKVLPSAKVRGAESGIRLAQ